MDRERALRGAVVLVVGLQFLVPLVALTRPDPPTRFGFQMYSGTGPLPALTTVDDAGRQRRVPLESIAAAARPEIDWADRAARHLCRTRPGVVEVRVVADRRERTVTC